MPDFVVMRAVPLPKERVYQTASGTFLIALIMVAGNLGPASAVDVPSCRFSFEVSMEQRSRAACGKPVLNALTRVCGIRDSVDWLGVEVVVSPLGCTSRQRLVDSLMLAKLGHPIDVNVAPPGVLVRIKGLGPVLAKRIISGRPYASWAQLSRVKGLGPKRMRAWRRHLTVGWPMGRSSPERRVP